MRVLADRGAGGLLEGPGAELDDNVLLVNGRELPTVVLRKGVPQRWRIVNVANGRFMRLSFPAEWQPYRIGGDGGLLREVYGSSKTLFPKIHSWGPIRTRLR